MKSTSPRKRRVAVLASLVCFASSLLAGSLEMVSRIDPAQASPVGAGGDSSMPVVSPDGRYVLFASTANNLVSVSGGSPVPARLSPRLNVFLRDRAATNTALVSANLNGDGGGNGDSLPASISDDGRYALFESYASDLVTNDTNNAPDVFVRDLLFGKTVLVSAATNGSPANSASRSSVMTFNGRFVAFVSDATDLTAADTNGIPDVFVRDLQTGETTLASPGATLVKGPGFTGGGSESPAITPDGRYVAFWSSATNVVPGLSTFIPGTKAVGEIYVRDLVTGTTTWASTGASHALQAAQSGANAVCYNHAISSDGRFVAYQASRGSSPYTNGLILRCDLQTGMTQPIHSNAVVTAAAPEEVRTLDMTADGRFVAFIANSGDSSGKTTCVLVWDERDGLNRLASGGPNGEIPPGSICEQPVLDRQGRFVAFVSNAPQLVTNLLAGGYHLYLSDLQAGRLTLVDQGTNGTGAGVSPATTPRLSADGRLVVFESPADSLVENDRNGSLDVFLRDAASDATELVSARDPLLPSLSPNGLNRLSAPATSADGRWLAFASEADDLAGRDTNGVRDVFVRDLLTASNILASVDTNGCSGNAMSFEPSISADGRYVAFTSRADNLVPGDANQSLDVFVRDLLAGTTVLASVSTNGYSPGQGDSYSPTISSDGRYVLFFSKAGNLTSRLLPAGEFFFLRDMSRQVTHALTISGTGVASASATPDLRFIGFTDGAGGGTLYLWESQQEAVTFSMAGLPNLACVGVSPDSSRLIYQTKSNSMSLCALDVAAKTNWTITTGGSPKVRPVAKFSADGRFMAYSWDAGTLYRYQVYLYDFQTGLNQLISGDYLAGTAPASPSDSPDISADGRFIAFRSAATNIVPGDANGFPDVFVYDRVSGASTLLSVDPSSGAAANNRSLNPVFSADGKILLFESWAAGLASGDFNGSVDIFAFDIGSATIPVFAARLAPGTAPRAPLLIWPVISGKNYRVQYKNDLIEPQWLDLAKEPTFNGSQASLEDSTAGSERRFYRIIAY